MTGLAGFFRSVMSSISWLIIRNAHWFIHMVKKSWRFYALYSTSHTQVFSVKLYGASWPFNRTCTHWIKLNRHKSQYWNITWWNLNNGDLLLLRRRPFLTKKSHFTDVRQVICNYRWYCLVPLRFCWLSLPSAVFTKSNRLIVTRCSSHQRR